MKVIILAGGYGTRLSEETEHIPKPMIEIGGRPLLWHLMKICSAQGFDEFVVALGYKGNIIKRYFLDYSRLESDLEVDLSNKSVSARPRRPENWKIALVDTGRDTMTGGRLRRLQDRVDGSVIFTYGDGLSNVDLSQLVKFHRAHGKLATVTAVRPPARFGLLSIDGDQVIRFNEKSHNLDSWVNGGFFVLEPEALEYIDGDQTSWEREPCERLARDGQLAAFRHEGYWQCVDTLHELRLLRDVWDKGQAPWKIW